MSNFKQDIYENLKLVIEKKKEITEKEKNLNIISINRRRERDNGNIPTANKIHSEEYIPLYEETEKLKEELKENNIKIAERIKVEEKVLEDKEKEFNKLSMERRKLRDDDNISEANNLHAEKIMPLYEEINSLRNEISEMKELVARQSDKDFKKMEEEVNKYLNEKTILHNKKESESKESKQNEERLGEQQGEPQPSREERKNKPQYIYSNSHDTINAININAKEGKAYVTLIKKEDRSQEIKEMGIEEILENKKEIFKNADVNALLERAGVNSRFQKFMARRKINPIILKAIEDNPDLTYDYIEAVVDEKEYPFNYKIDLTDSKLSKKANSALNKLALKERKIEGNEVVGAKRLYKIRNLFNGNKNQNAIEPAKEPEKLLTSNNIIDNVKVDYDELIKQQNEATNSAYSNLSQEQKDDLKKLSVSDIQRLRPDIDYNTAYNLKQTYGKDDTESSPTQNEPDQVK